jgi:hypothetical protein
MIKVIIGTLLIFVSIFCVALYGAGSHGHFAFRPWMVEDWIIWGTALITGMIGIVLLTMTYANRGRKHNGRSA